MTVRRLRAWTLFLAAIALVFAGLVALSVPVVRSERSEAIARAEAMHQENIRLTLWRLDAFLTPLITRESARPYFHYQPFYAADRAYARMLQDQDPAAPLVPSPLLLGEPSGEVASLIRLHFQIDPDGGITSPQAPTGPLLQAAESALAEATALVRGQTAVIRLRRLLESGALGGLLEPALLDAPAVASAPDLPSSESRSESEYYARFEAALQANQRQISLADPTLLRLHPPDDGDPGAAPETPPDRRAASPADHPGMADLARELLLEDAGEPRIPLRLATEPPARVEVSPFRAVWAENPEGGLELFLIRRAAIGDRAVTQGLWLDWPALHDRLLRAARILLPEARLVPVQGQRPGGTDPALLLATLPVRLDAGPAALPTLPTLTPLRLLLCAAWAAVVAAAVAMAVVLRRSIQLSERRGRFVSAVTHELRTPLTTFTLYSQMLADGMVPDDEARQRYLATLREEARRLGAIVENVLEYARLDQRRRPTAGRPIAASELLGAILPPLTERARQSDMRVSAEGLADPALARATVRADTQTVERILLNLVENACKYARPDDRVLDPRRWEITLAAEVVQSDLRRPSLEILVADRGPGIPPEAREAVFSEFQRGASAVRAGRPGLGLGLALARGLARELGGDLTLVRRRGQGAEFLLTLPARLT